MKQIARENIKIDDKELDEETALKMIDPKNFTDRNLKKKDIKIILESHNIKHASFLLSIIPIFLTFGTETKCINKILKEMANIYARLKNQCKFKYHKFFFRQLL